jgi:VWFA-related protein
MKHVLSAALVAVSLVVPHAGAQSNEKGARTRDVYASVTDQKGNPVAGLGVADFAVREDNATREVLKVAPSTEPLQIVLLIDDSQASEPAIQFYRDALPKFFDKLAGKAEIGVVTVGERPTSLVEHTTDTAALKKGVSRIFARPGSGSYLLDGIVEVLKGIKKREVATRVHILAVTIEASTEFSNLHYQQVLDQLYASPATLDVLCIGQPNTSLDDETKSKNQTIAEGTEKTGGRRDQVLAAMGLSERLQKVADDFLNEYVVTYGRPEQLIPPTKIQVTSPKPGVTVRARTRLPGSGR